MALSMVPCPGGTGTAYTTTQCIYDDTTGTYEQIISCAVVEHTVEVLFVRNPKPRRLTCLERLGLKDVTRVTPKENYTLFTAFERAITLHTAGNPAQQGQTPL